MLILSLAFFGFSAGSLLLYYLLPARYQNGLLLAVSYAFYLTWSWTFALVLLGSTFLNYAIGLRIGRRAGRRRAWLAFGIALNVGFLAFFKLAGFFLPALTRALSRWGLHPGILRIMLPVGLSFYSLQAIGYLVDLSRGQVASTGFLDFALAMSYFPKLVAGPIERFREFLPRLARPRTAAGVAWGRSFTLIVIGLVRKVVVADTLLAAVPSSLTSNPGRFSPLELILWMATFLVGLYNDFAGYTEIVRGVSGFFGIELSRNFAFPLFSRNFTEFWSRWHMTLSGWLRDYVYFPLSRAIVRRDPRRYNLTGILVPPIVTMAVSGIWHGTGWNFVAWGLVMGLVLALERIPSLWRPVVSPDKRPLLRRWLGIAGLWAFAILAGFLFRASLPDAMASWARIFSGTPWTLPACRVFVVALLGFGIDAVQHRRKDEWAFLAWPRGARAALLAAALLAVFLFSQAQIPEPFFYQGF